MKFTKIKSYAKVNVSLGVLGKSKSKLHKIESLIVFINLYDEIFIKKIKSKNHKVIFMGKFSKGISQSNTIINLLRIFFGFLNQNISSDTFLQNSSGFFIEFE